MTKIWNKCNIITFLGMAFAVIGIHFSYIEKINLAVIMLVLSGICDAFDGTVARKIGQDKADREYGIQLDSLADIISSGILPIIICLSLGFNKIIEIPVYIIFLACGISRLAYYNVNSDNKKYFNGVPITSSAILIPLLYMITDNEYIYMLSFIIISILFVANIKIKKPNIKTRAILVALGVILSIIIILIKNTK